MMRYGSTRFWRAHRYVVRWYGRYPRCGPFFWYFHTRRAAAAAARALAGEYEIATLPDNRVIEWKAGVR